MQYKIGGCDVAFPHQAYGVQLSFMNKVINALEGGHNALLEAPTGSGKTLSLLCSSLAWQQREKQRIEEGLAAERMRAAAGEQLGEQEPPGYGYTSPAKQDGGMGVKKEAVTPGQAGDGGFLPTGSDGSSPEGAAPAPCKKPPKIFYATRTHSQIAQVVRELHRSNYKPKMAVLASRKQYCINKFALSKPSVDETCEELRADGNCKYHKGFMALVTGGMAHRVHDIEELCNYGRANKACPYYASRQMAKEAELIFSPYSYLLDPVIRRAMSIDVSGSMLVFDEAHNIEDVCREAASCEVDMTTMIEVCGALSKAMAANGKPEIYGPLAEAATKVLTWLTLKEGEVMQDLAKQRRPKPATKLDPYEIVFQAGPLLDQLAAAGLGPDKVDTLWECYQLAREEDEAMSGNAGGPQQQQGEGNENAGANQQQGADPAATNAVRVGALALGVLSRLIHTVKLLHQASDDGSRDYRLVLQRYEDHISGARFQGRSVKRADVDEDGEPRAANGVVVTLCLWCLNPAVAFKEVSETAHSIILTSGTLAPLDGFASELGAPFQIRLEAPHVVDMRKQVWAGIITNGPGNYRLEGSYQYTSDQAYQDAVGRTVLECCATIPDGVLMFVSSYTLMDKLMKRWKETRLLNRLSRLKKIVSEPRTGGNDALQKVMDEYYSAIKSGQGGLFMAVCRGKVSEGLDFADANARGVIIVGIPFPAARDTKVLEKKSFNTRGQKSMGLLSGDAWYSQQAFRALNQAVGRCIRHRFDWGAIVLVDDRFKQPRNQAGLSRWVRGALVVHQTFESALSSMQGFFMTIQANPPKRPQQQQQQQQQPATEDEVAASIAAAVAQAKAAAAAAAGLPAPTQQWQPGAGVPGGRAITQAVGRGAEGALGDWSSMHSSPPHDGGRTGTRSKSGFEAAPGAPAGGGFYVCQGKPLAQARMACTADATAAQPSIPPASQQVQQPRLQPQSWQQPAPPPPPHHQQPQQRQQHQPQQQQQRHAQQQWQQPGSVYPRQQSHPLWQEPLSAQQQAARPGGVHGPPTREALQRVLQRAPLARWASQDVAMYMAFLAQRGVNPGEVAMQSMQELAIAAITDSFEAAREFLGQGQSLVQLAAEWLSALPRGLQAVMAASGEELPPQVEVDAAVVSFGRQHLWGCPVQLLLEAMQGAYARALQGSASGDAGPPAMCAPHPPAQASSMCCQPPGQVAAADWGGTLGELPTQPYQEVVACQLSCQAPMHGPGHDQPQQQVQQHALQPQFGGGAEPGIECISPQQRQRSQHRHGHYPGQMQPTQPYAAGGPAHTQQQPPSQQQQQQGQAILPRQHQGPVQEQEAVQGSGNVSGCSWSDDSGQEGSAGKKRAPSYELSGPVARPRNKSAKGGLSSAERQQGLEVARFESVAAALQDSDDDFL